MKQGEEPSKDVIKFIVDTKSIISELTHQQLADLVYTKFGIRIDKSSVGRYINQNKTERQQPTGRVMDFPAYLHDQIKKHHDMLRKTLSDFQGLSVFPARGDNLERWLSRPDEPQWPITQGHICRDGGNKLVVRLFMDGQLEWEYLQQHLVGDPLWGAVEEWKLAMAKDVMARSKLHKELVGKVRSGTGLEIVADISVRESSIDVLGSYYVHILYDQIFSNTIGIRLDSKRRDEFFVDQDCRIKIAGYTIAALTDDGRAEDVINFLLDAQTRFAKLPSVKIAKIAYEKAEGSTIRLKNELKRILLAPGLPPYSWCDGCKDWLNRW